MIDAKTALTRLKEGNRRFASDTQSLDLSINQSKRESLASGQEPFAAIIGCSDSRVPVEIVIRPRIGGSLRDTGRRKHCGTFSDRKC